MVILTARSNPEGQFCLILSIMKKMITIALFFCFTMALQAQQIPKLKMTDVVNSFSNKSDTVYVINFWATFCKPCVAEIPDFIKITNKYKNQKVKLVLVSVDLPSFYPTKIAAFAKHENFFEHAKRF